MIDIVRYWLGTEVSSNSSIECYRCNQAKAPGHVVCQGQNKPFGRKLEHRFHFAKRRSRATSTGDRRRDYCGWRIVLLSCIQSMHTFLRRNSPLWTDLCSSESESVPVPLILQAARRKPSLSCSRRSGLSTNQMLSSPGRLRWCLPCGRSEVQCPVAQPMHVEVSLAASKT